MSPLETFLRSIHCFPEQDQQRKKDRRRTPTTATTGITPKPSISLVHPPSLSEIAENNLPTTIPAGQLL